MQRFELNALSKRDSATGPSRARLPEQRGEATVLFKSQSQSQRVARHAAQRLETRAGLSRRNRRAPRKPGAWDAYKY